MPNAYVFKKFEVILFMSGPIDAVKIANAVKAASLAYSPAEDEPTLTPPEADQFAAEVAIASTSEPSSVGAEIPDPMIQQRCARCPSRQIASPGGKQSFDFNSYFVDARRSISIDDLTLKLKLQFRNTPLVVVGET